MLILLANLIIVPIMYYGSIDDFSPKHMALVHETSQRAYLSENAKSLFPGFIAMGSIINLLVGINARDLLFYPIQWAPYLIIIFCLYYEISKSYILSAILASVIMITGTSGTLSIFFWPHGIGNILFYIFLILIILLSGSRDSIRSQIKLLMIIIGVSLIYISYNLSANILLLILSLTLLNYVIFFYKKNNSDTSKENYHMARGFFILFAILLITQLGLFNFVYGVFLPTLEDMRTLELSTIDKFFVSYISKDIVQTQLSNLIILKPQVLFPLGIIKQASLMLSIFISILLIFKKFKHTKVFESSDMVLICITISAVFYGLIRIPLGATDILTCMTLPGMISISWLYRYSAIFKKWSVLISIFLIFSSLFYYYEIYDNELMNKDSYEFINIDTTSRWFYEYCFGHAIVASDELTKNIYIIYLSIEQNMAYSNITSSVNILTTPDILFLLQQPCELKPANKYYLINYNLNRLCIGNWMYINSWKKSENIINHNSHLNSYEARCINIYQSN